MTEKKFFYFCYLIKYNNNKLGMAPNKTYIGVRFGAGKIKFSSVDPFTVARVCWVIRTRWWKNQKFV